MGVANLIKVIIAGEEKGLKEAVGKANEDLGKLSKGTETHMAKAQKAASAGLAAIATGGAALVGIALKNGDALNESQDRLQTAVEASGGSFDKLVPSLKAVQKTSEGLGFTNAETNDALSAGTVATGSYRKSLGLLGVAQDLARFKHIGLAVAEVLVVKASEGQTKGLKALGIDLPVAAGGAAKLQKAQTALWSATVKYKDTQALVHAGLLKGPAAFKALAAAQDKMKTAQANVNAVQSAGGQIVAALGQKLDGQAVTATKSLAGKTEILKAKFTDMTAHLGQKLIPIVLTVGQDFMKLVGFFSSNKTALDLLIGAVAALVTGMLALKVIAVVQKATELWTAAQAALNVVMDANPLALVALAVVAVGVAIFEAYKHFGPFKTAVDAVWQALQTGFHWVQANWPLLLAILTGPIGIAVLLISRHWSDITNGFHSVVSGISTGVDNIVGFITGLPGRILGAATSFGSTLLHGILSGIGGAASAVTGFVQQIGRAMDDLINKYIIDPIRNIDIKWGGFHGIGKFDIHPFSFIPRLHSGGTFMSGAGEGLALLRDGETVRTPEQESRLGASGPQVHQHFYGSVDPRYVRAQSDRWARRNGTAA